MRAADFELAGRIDVVAGIAVRQVRRNHGVDNDLPDKLAELVLARERVAADRVVLRRDHNRIDPLWTVPVVLHRDLGLSVGPQEGQSAGPAHFGESSNQPVGQHDRQGHQLVRLSAGKAEHQSLVPRSAGIHSPRDVGGLLVHVRMDLARVGIE